MKTRGFTLLELLTVISIIGFLTTIAMASLNTAKAKARDAQRFTDLNAFEKGLAFYYDEYGVYPCGGADEIDGFVNGGGVATFDTSDSCDVDIYDPDKAGFLNGNIAQVPPQCDTSIGPAFGLTKEGILQLNCHQDPLETPGVYPDGLIPLPNYTYLYAVTADRQKYLLSTYMENETLNLNSNDQGLCDDAYEIGPSLGEIRPRVVGHWDSPSPGCDFNH